MFLKYFAREKFTYWLHCLFPMILVAEIYIYMSVTNITSETREMIDVLILNLAIMATGIMLVLQLVSCTIFHIRLLKLTTQQKQKLRETARNSKKTGRILQSDEVLIYYGKYSKKVIFKNQISSMEGYTDSDFKHVRGGSVITKMNFITMKRKSGRDIVLMCPMKVLDGYAGELPWTSLIVSGWLGLALTIMAVYPSIMNIFMNEKDVLEKVLFHAGYEWLFWLISAVTIAVLWFVAFRLKNKYVVDESYRGFKLEMTTFWFYLCVFMFGWIFLQEKYEDSYLARADFKAYRENEYEQTVGVAENIYEQYADEGTRYMPLFMEEQGIDFRTLSCRMNERGTDYEGFIQIEYDTDINLGQDVRITYLRNTKIVIAVEPE